MPTIKPKTKPRRQKLSKPTPTKKNRIVKSVVLKPVGIKKVVKKKVVAVPVTSERRKISPLWFLLLAYLGTTLIMASGFYFLYRQTILSFKVSPTVVSEAHLRADRPKRIKIDRVEIQTEILPASITDGIWETSDSTATHLTTSSRPSEGGNVVIYAHNQKPLFANLHQARQGDLITVETEDNRAFQYRIDSITVVDPSQINLVLPTDHEVLTVYTCTGFLDSKRLVVQATPQAVQTL